MLKQYRISLTLFILIFFLGSLRMFSVVTQQPVLGYGNHYDMIRVQSCHQIWPVNTQVPKGYPTPFAPNNLYTFDSNSKHHDCFVSTELLFTSTTVAILSYLGLETFSMTSFGITKAILFMLVSLSFLIWFMVRKKLGVALCHTIIYSLIIADPANTLYFNTFYTETSALFFLYTSLLLFYVVASDGMTRINAMLFGLSLVYLALSKPQHILLPIVILAIFLITQIQTIKLHRIATIVLLVMVGAAVFYQAQYRQTKAMYYVNYANATNTFLYTVLPAATDIKQAATILNLPSGCIEHAGKSWYSNGINNQNHPCPEVQHTSRLSLIQLLAYDPHIILKTSFNAIQHMRPWVLYYLGTVGEQHLGRMENKAWTLSKLIDAIPEPILKILFFMPMTLLGFLFAALLSRRFLEIKTELSLLLCLISLKYIVFYSALFGDGYIEFAKHTHLYFSLYLAIIFIVIALVAKYVKNRIDC